MIQYLSDTAGWGASVTQPSKVKITPTSRMKRLVLLCMVLSSSGEMFINALQPLVLWKEIRYASQARQRLAWKRTARKYARTRTANHKGVIKFV